MEPTLPVAATTPAELATSVPHPDGSLTIRQAMWLVGVLFLWQVPLSVPALLTNVLAEKTGIDLFGIPELLAFAGTFWLVIRHARRRYGITPPSIRPANRQTVPLPAYLLLAAGTFFLGLLIEPLAVLIPAPGWLNDILKATFTKNIILSAVLGAPIFEEMLFRGVLLTGLLKRYTPTRAILLSAAIFAFVHLNPAQSIGAFFLGVALGWVYYRTGSIWPGMVMHFVNNAISSLVFLFDDSMDMTSNMTRVWMDNDIYYAGLLLLSALCTYGCYVGLSRLLPEKPLRS